MTFVPIECGQLLSGLRVPQLDGIVRTARSERLAVGREPSVSGKGTTLPPRPPLRTDRAVG